MMTRIPNKDPTGRLVPITCQDDLVHKKQSLDLNPGGWTPEATCLATVLRATCNYNNSTSHVLMGIGRPRPRSKHHFARGCIVSGSELIGALCRTTNTKSKHRCRKFHSVAVYGLAYERGRVFKAFSQSFFWLAPAETISGQSSSAFW